MTTTPATETKIVRVTRREFYDSFGEIVYFLRVPAGMTTEEIESHNCWHDGIDAGETHPENGIACLGRIDDSNEKVIKRLEPTRGVDFDEIREVSEEELQEELDAEPAEEVQAITIQLEAYEDLCEWVNAGGSLDWWLQNGDGQDPETYALAQRVHAHLCA
jgi:hypothetical protein